MSTAEAETLDEAVVPEEVSRPVAPVAEVAPIISVGDWVRLQKVKGVPTNLVGRLATVVSAVVLHAEGGDSISDRPYDYQYHTAPFTVRVRDTGDVLVNLTRSAFLSWGPTEGDVERHSG